MKTFISTLAWLIISLPLLAQNPVTGLPSQWSDIKHFDCIEFNAGNKMYIGGRSSEGFISWNAYPETPLGAARFRFSGATAAQIVYPNWAGRIEFRFSSNTATFGQPVSWATNMVVTQNGNIGMGTLAPQARLHLQGGDFLMTDAGGTNQFRVGADGFLRARQIDVDLDPIPDYVFEPDYALRSLPELRQYIEEHKHLPGIKSAKEYEEVGSINVGELQLQLLEKVEELTLYVLQLEADLKALKQDQK